MGSPLKHTRFYPAGSNLKKDKRVLFTFHQPSGILVTMSDQTIVVKKRASLEWRFLGPRVLSTVLRSLGVPPCLTWESKLSSLYDSLWLVPNKELWKDSKYSKTGNTEQCMLLLYLWLLTTIFISTRSQVHSINYFDLLIPSSFIKKWVLSTHSPSSV